MNHPMLISESTLTDRYQTTVPNLVRKALHLHKREKIRYTIQPDGSVLLSRADQSDDDPVLDGFLNYLAQDMRQNPQHLKSINPDLLAQVQNLVADVPIDLAQPLSGEIE